MYELRYFLDGDMLVEFFKDEAEYEPLLDTIFELGGMPCRFSWVEIPN